ncbi:NusG domain II-containing protein [Spirochaetota bacterium]
MPLKKPVGGLQVKPLDLAIVILAAFGLLWTLLFGFSRTGSPVLIISSGTNEWLYPMSENRTISISGLIGETVIKIEGEKASIISSPCDNKTCIASPPVKNPGDWSACLPNAVMIRIDSKAVKNELDAFSY